MLRFVFGAVLVFCALPVSAQVYYWNDAQTGAKRLSNIPPDWYKAPDSRSFPRVQVFENGRLVDDTALKDEQRFELRANSSVARGLAPLRVAPAAQPRQ